MLYVRKLFTQDLRDGKQIAFPKEPSLSFFAFDYLNKEDDRNITFTFRAKFDEFQEHDGTVILTRLYAAGSESRMDGEVKAFIRDTLHANVDDLLIMKNKGNKHTDYEFMFVPKSNPMYATLLSLTCGDNHSVYSIEEEQIELDDLPLQQIFYGAPGTGKSHQVEDICKLYKHYRTTFHPDSDYSTFVGCYKPTKKTSSQVLSTFKLHDLFAAEKGTFSNRPEYRFIAKHYNSFAHLTLEEAKAVFKGISEDTVIAAEVPKGMAMVEELAKLGLDQSSISYEFVPQAFTRAYIEAWKEPSEEVFLVIEEINRGNCAQIFGDLFQLLDRNDEGYSSYEITPDTDLQRYIAEQGLQMEPVADNNGEDISQQLMSGTLMALPPNLHIWATMNTSDQSLFPIDSAFKRRWDWKYVPIDPEAKSGWKIEVNGRKYSWSSFLEKINKEIEDTTSSEDKQLGFFFCKAKDTDEDCNNGTITAEKFVSKVLFYLYNDVFKDYGLDQEFFKNQENAGKKISFRSLFKTDGDINQGLVAMLLDNLGVEVLGASSLEDDLEEEDIEFDSADAGNKGHKETLVAVTVNGDRLTADDMTQFDLYLNAIKKLGVSKVAPVIETLKYRRKGCPMATTEMFAGILDSVGYSYVEADGYYFVKGAQSYTLIRILEDLKKRLSLDIQVEYR